MPYITIQRPDNRDKCRESWVPLAIGVEAEVEDYGDSALFRTPFMAGVKAGQRILHGEEKLEITGAVADDRRALTIVAIRRSG